MRDNLHETMVKVNLTIVFTLYYHRGNNYKIKFEISILCFNIIESKKVLRISFIRNKLRYKLLYIGYRDQFLISIFR